MMFRTKSAINTSIVDRSVINFNSRAPWKPTNNRDKSLEQSYMNTIDRNPVKTPKRDLIS